MESFSFHGENDSYLMGFNGNIVGILMGILWEYYGNIVGYDGIYSYIQGGPTTAMELLE